MPSDIFNDDMLLEYARVNFIKPPTNDGDEGSVAPIAAGGVRLGGYEAKRAGAVAASADDSLKGAVLRASDSTFKFILSQQVGREAWVARQHVLSK